MAAGRSPIHGRDRACRRVARDRPAREDAVAQGTDEQVDANGALAIEVAERRAAEAESQGGVTLLAPGQKSSGGTGWPLRTGKSETRCSAELLEIFVAVGAVAAPAM